MTRTASKESKDCLLGKRKRAGPQANCPLAAQAHDQNAVALHSLVFEQSSTCVKDVLTMTNFESTKLTKVSGSKRQRTTTVANFTSFAIKEAEDPSSIDLIAESAIGQPEETSAPGPANPDEILMTALKNKAESVHLLGLPARKLKSLKFRLRRREIKVLLSGTPFNKRESLKNSNRQTAALQRKRDGNGKFLNVPIFPKKQATSENK